MKTRAPRRLFRARRQKPVDVVVIEIGGKPGKPLGAVRAFIESHRRTFRPVVHQIVTLHDSHCRYPSGGTCSCVSGPEMRIVGLDPVAN
jgi:hypothetical protein